VDPSAEVADVARQPLFVLRHRYPIDSRAGLPLLSSKRPKKTGFIDMVQQSREPGLGSLLGRRVHPLEVRRQGNPALCPDPDLLAPAPLGLALPSTRLVSFDGFTGTTNRPQLGQRLWQCLAAVPNWRPIQNVSASDGPMSIPRISHRPSLLTPTAMITATDTESRCGIGVLLCARAE
jgi:hypothetical protein